MRIIQIDETVSYIEPTESPLSANIVLIRGKDYLWLYDVGNNPEAVNLIPTDKPINAILSHFHPDHIGNLERLSVNEIYEGKNTFGYTHRGIITDSDLYIEDGDLKLHLFPLASSHAKGSLALEVNEKYLFLGDASYPAEKMGQALYNATFLKEQIDKLKTVSAEFFLESHSEPFLKTKSEVLNKLTEIYKRRNKNEAYIKSFDF